MTNLDYVHQLDKEISVYGIKCMFRAFADKGLYPGQPALLKTIRQLAPCSQSQLARALGVSTSSVGVSIKRMQKAGYLKKEPDPKDLRYNTISLTPAGEKICRQAEDEDEALARRRLEGFTDAEIQQFASFLERIRDNTRRYYERDEQ